MSKKVIKAKIFRFNPSVDEKPRYQEYEVPIEDEMSALDVLDYIYDNIDPTLAYYSHTACRRGVCGRCMLVVNGKASLTCQTLVTEDVTIEPPSKSKIIRDLIYKTNK